MSYTEVTLEQLQESGLVSPEALADIERYTRHIKETGDLPPAQGNVKVTFIGRPLKVGENLVPMNTRITETQRDFLDHYAKQTGETRADIIREAIDLLRTQKPLATA